MKKAFPPFSRSACAEHVPPVERLLCLSHRSSRFPAQVALEETMKRPLMHHERALYCIERKPPARREVPKSLQLCICYKNSF